MIDPIVKTIYCIYFGLGVIKDHGVLEVCCKIKEDPNKKYIEVLLEKLKEKNDEDTI